MSDACRNAVRSRPRNAAFVDIADQPAPIGPFEEDFLQHAVFDQRRTHFSRAHID
jgi:hypothetical protein